jgi:NADH:ubiquinone oxidoreductase subunit H
LVSRDYIIIRVVTYILFLLCVLLRIAYYTLFERKILRYSQRRVGPNKRGGWGLIQPVFDGVKLIGKERFVTSQRGLFIFSLLPLSLFPFIVERWLIPSESFIINESLFFLVLFFLRLLGLSVFGLLLSGIISSSKFGYLGGIRASAQSVRYEIGLSLVVFSFQALSEGLV